MTTVENSLTPDESFARELTVSDYLNVDIKTLIQNPSFDLEVVKSVVNLLSLTGPELLAKLEVAKPVTIYYRNHTAECSVCDWSNVGRNETESRFRAEMHGLQEHPCNFVLTRKD